MCPSNPATKGSSMGCSALMAAYPVKTHTLLQIKQSVKYFIDYTIGPESHVFQGGEIALHHPSELHMFRQLLHINQAGVQHFICDLFIDDVDS